MIFHQSSRHNAIKNILLAGVGVTAFPSFNIAAANYYAGSNTFLKVAISPAILLMIFSVIYFSRKNFYRWHEACKAALNPVGNFKITHSRIFG